MQLKPLEGTLNRRPLYIALAFCVTAFWMTAAPAHVEAAIYLKIDGIDGDATQEDHRKWISVEAAGASINRAAALVSDAEKKKDPFYPLSRQISHPVLTEFEIVKQLDISSIYLLRLALDETPREAKIHFVTTGSPGQTYLEITLTGVVISSISMTSGGDRPVEVVTLNFTTIEWRYIPLESNNEAGSPVGTNYDLLNGARF